MRVRWFVLGVALAPAVAGAVSLLADPSGDFRSSGFLAGVALSLGIVAAWLAMRRPWRTTAGLRRLASVAGIGLLGAAALGGLAGGLPDFLTEQFGLFIETDDYGPRAVVAVEDGFVAAGADLDGGVIWFSGDGSIWSRVDVPSSLADLDTWDLVLTDGGMLAISRPSDSDDGVVLSSPDGQDWEVAGRFGKEVGFGVAPQIIDVLGDTLVVVGGIYGNDVVYFHGHDVDSLRVAEPAPTFDAGNWVVDAVCGDRGCIAAGGRSDVGLFTTSDVGAAVWNTSDGQRWSLSEASFDEAVLTGAAATRDGFVVVGNDVDADHGVVFTSSDGLKWTRGTGLSAFKDAVIDGVVSLEGVLVVYGRHTETGAILVWKATGTQWHQSIVDGNAPVGSRIRSIATSGMVVVAIGIDTAEKSAAVWTSSDGQTWLRGAIDR